MKIEQATEADSDLLKQFMHKHPVITGMPLELAIDRKGSFFDKYRLQTEDFVTYKLVSDDEQLEGVASMLFRKTLLNGAETLVGFASDLRVAPNRQAILQWPDKLLPALTDAANERGCQYVFSILNATQTHAYNALIRPRSQRRNIPRYYMYRKFEVVTIHGRLPFSNLPFLSTIKISQMQKEDLEPLAFYLKSKAVHKPLSFQYSVDLLKKRFDQWNGFGIGNFLIARDAKKNIIGCVAPWKASQVMQISVMKYSGFGETLYSFSKWFSYFNLVKRLPLENESLNVKFLTHFYADNPDIFAALLAECYHTSEKNELLSYTHFVRTPLSMPPKNFLTTKLPFSIYTVLPSEKALPEFLLPQKVTPPPEIEPLLI